MTNGSLLGFIIWLAVGLLFVGEGIFCFRAKKATGFWANAKTPSIEDVKSYNRAMGKLWCVYGVVLMVLGLPLLFGNGGLIMASCVGVMVEAILTMAVYTLKIERKYRKSS